MLFNMKQFPKNSYSRGFTLIELIIVLLIGIILTSVGVTTLVSYRNFHTVAKEKEAVMETLLEARNLTIVSKNATVYGVHFASTTITLFSGSSYSAENASNKVYDLAGGIEIWRYFPSGGNDIIFSRISGETNQSSTATVRLVNSSASTTVTIYKTGTIE